MSIKVIEIADIEAGDRLRPLNPAWVAQFAEQIEAGAQMQPIEVVERAEGARPYLLMTGGHRLAGHVTAGRSQIEARVFAEALFPTQAAVRQREIDENVQRYDLTVLDRAVFMATWKEIYEAEHKVDRRGGKRRGDGAETNSGNFQKRFSLVSAAVLDVSEGTIQDWVRIARNIPRAIRDRIAFAPIASKATELLQLAAQPVDRQEKIVGLLLAEPALAGSVAEAVAVLDRTPAPPRLASWQRVSDRFSRLKEAEQAEFFNAHADAIDAWLASRGRSA